MGIGKAWDLLTAKVLGWTRDFILLLPNLAVAVAVVVEGGVCPRPAPSGSGRG